jgi:hypothetical protein
MIDIEPFAYLSFVFEQLPTSTTVEALEALLPWNFKARLTSQKPTSNGEES